jgi:hypothetical protein
MCLLVIETLAIGVSTNDPALYTNLFWDCACEENFIHPVSEDGCGGCGVERGGQPPSLVVEVLRQKSRLPKGLIEIVESALGEPDDDSIPF